MSTELMVIDAQTAVDRATHYANTVSLMTKDILHEGIDYGIIPGTDKKVLLKPGAEKLCTAFTFAPDFDPLPGTIQNWEGNGFFNYHYKCILRHAPTGVVVATANGSCNSKESKYRWRVAKLTCPECGEELRKSKKGDGFYCWERTGGCGQNYAGNDPRVINQERGKVENDDVFSLVNTIDKMAQKRALVAAVLIATGASEHFTQDLEDMTDIIEITPGPVEPKEAPRDNGKPKKSQPQSGGEGSDKPNNTEPDTVPENAGRVPITDFDILKNFLIDKAQRIVDKNNGAAHQTSGSTGMRLAKEMTELFGEIEGVTPSQATEHRHRFLKAVFEKESTNDLSHAEVSALDAWKQDANAAIEEIKMFIESEKPE